MHITEWEASRSGAGITVAMTDAAGVRHKQFVKKIEGKNGGIVAVGGDGNRIHLVAASGETSPEVASIAGKLLDAPIVDCATCDALIESIAHANSRDQAHAAILNELSILRDGVRKLAASCLGQHQ